VRTGFWSGNLTKRYDLEDPGAGGRRILTLSLLMSNMELLVKPEILTLYIYIYICGPTSGNAESRLFLFAAQCFNTESIQKVILWHSCV
jgi:hypothetical protein